MIRDGDVPDVLPGWSLGRKLLLLVPLGLLPGLMLASQSYLMYQAEERAVSWLKLAGWYVTIWYFWVPATLLVLAFSRRVPLERARLAAALPAHLLCALLCFALFVAHTALVTPWLAPEPYSLLPRQRIAGHFALLYFHVGMRVYGGVVGIEYAVDYYCKYRERELLTSRLQTQLAQAQLQALKMQPHPHFLFNTLNAISNLVRKNENRDAVRMLAASTWTGSRNYAPSHPATRCCSRTARG